MRPIGELLKIVEAEGEAGLARVAVGPALIEIPTQDPTGRLSGTAERASTTARTTNFDENVLLDLRRARMDRESRAWFLESGATVGRSSSCTVHLDGEEGVSKEHARFDLREGAWHLVDLGSTNGTFVERRRVEPSGLLLEGVSAVQTGSRRFAFVPVDDLLALLTPVATCEAIQLERLRFELEAFGSRRFLLRHAGHYLVLTHRDEAGAPREAFPLLPPGPLTLGRTSQADLTVKRGSVSKWHAKLSFDGESWSIQDTGSSNGTVVNGRRLEKDALARLNAYDALSFGPSVNAAFLTGRGLLEFLVDGAGEA